ncbi:HTTM domain-containing protein [Actinomycetospora callitridis]|uniref:HTTM domain-containing protein n=1 Tax=Actinomycetospora callitridis TaxID=913944 RepID=UPI0023671770|nr:HTTM domain-containing protein [Actinomycetospora callitridis]MDD7916319.1 HTTM domain-containing protein [Actinomycetospora callitridis]
MTATWDRVRTGWNTFWFRPEPTSTIALVRIVFGFVATLWTLSQLPTLLTFYGPRGVLPVQPELGPGAWTLLGVSTSAPVVISLWVVTLLGAIGVMIGFRTRLATILLFVGVLSFERRDPYILNAGDVLLRTLAFYLVFSPAGAALSVDRWRHARERFWEFPLRAPWALRLMQIQLSVIYFATLWGKLQGDRWRDGTAVSYALRIDDIHRFATPGFLTDSVVLSEILTFGTLLLELALAILVWNRTLRPWVLALGVSLHLSIAFSIMVGFFTMLMLTLYLAFIPAETARRLILSAPAARRRRKATRRKVTRRPPGSSTGRPPAHSTKSDRAESSDVVRS